MSLQRELKKKQPFESLEQEAVLNVLSALEDGYHVFVVTDASGTFNKSVRDAALMRMAHAGATMTNWFAVACELQRDWRNDAEGLASLLANHLPAYKNLMTSYQANTKQ